MDTLKVKQSALKITDPNCFAKVEQEEGQVAKLEMLAYSGKVIPDHWYWGDLAIDLSGMSFPKKSYPLLEQHDVSRKLGFIKKLSTENNELRVIDAEFIDTEESRTFQKNSKEGFPYEASIRAYPTNIERLEKDAVADVNGFKMKGPGTIWRKSVFRESSACVFGYDSNTKSAAFAEDEEIELSVESSNVCLTIKEDQRMPFDLTKFKEENKDAFSEIVTDVRKEMEQEFSTKEKDFTDKIASLTSENEKLSADNKTVNDRMTKLEKDFTIQKEKTIKTEADNIVSTKFTEAGVPDRLQGKIRKLISHQEFIKEDVLDVTAFSKAIDDELKDWEFAKTDAVLGGGDSGSGRDVADNGDDESQFDAAADELFNLSGATVQK